MYKDIRNNSVNLIRRLVNLTPFAPLLKRVLRSPPDQKALHWGRERGWDKAASWMLNGDGRAILRDPSFHRRFRDAINENIDTELLLVALRKMLLLSRTNYSQNNDLMDTLVTLIVQAHNNEFVWLVTDDEKRRLKKYVDRILDQQWSEDQDGPLPLLLLLYQRIGSAGISFDAHKLEILRLRLLTLGQRKIIDELVEEVRELRNLSPTIENFAGTTDATSKEIENLYDEYPYPRWLSWEIGALGSRISMLRQYFRQNELDFTTRPFTVLVAGCGTGSKAIAYSVEYGANVDIVAIDLSRASLAYAKRMADKHGVRNIRFIQMDLRNLGRWSRRFDIVECTGVLHHLLDPIEGGRAIIESAKDSAIIHISLYSTQARRSLAFLREKYELTPQYTPDEIREVRMRMLEEDGDFIDAKLSLRNNFFDLNRCKDLLFHPLERTFTIADVGCLLKDLDLDFRGIERPDIVRNQYWTRFPRPRNANRLDAWNDFEQRYPTAFQGLYEIWSKKN